MERRRSRPGKLAGPLPVLVLAALSASGCGSLDQAPVLNVTAEKWSRTVAARGVDPAEVPMPMSVTPQIRAVAEKVAGPGDERERLRRLQSALLDRSAYAFEYDTVATFTAQEAFEARRGNCVSFTNLFIAFGRAVGIPLQAALLFRRASSEKEGDLVMVYNHMVAVHPKGRYVTVYDFYMTRENANIEVRLIDDLAVAAIAASNRGVEALRAGDLDEAGTALEKAIRLQPAFPDLYSNLGIVRWRQGDVEEAYEVFRQGLELDPRRATLLHNLAALHLDQGRRLEARAALAAAATREATPFLFVVQGDLEMAAGNLKAALTAYRRAHRDGRDLLEPLLGIARAELGLGDREAARRALRKAEKLRPEDPQVQALLENLSGP
ncbi:MAG TPA: tetratricopeptide repeat protein [Thermoanaerobaculia bacterium]|nr:tetratricopeptide repeat protein [Thermoanaerobaculia bacterium]